MPQPCQESFRAEIAAYLRTNRDELLHAWLVKTRTEVPAADDERTPVLVDHMPDFVSRLADLFDPESAESPAAPRSAMVPEIHGIKRAQLPAYSLPQVLWEYSLLRRTIVAALEVAELLTPHDRDLLLDAVDRAMCHAAVAFVAERSAIERQEQLKVTDERDRLYDAARAILGEQSPLVKKS